MVQRRISIYKALNGNDFVDKTFLKYMVDLGTVNLKISKWDDAILAFKEALKIGKKISTATAVEIKAWDVEITKLLDQANKEKDAEEAA